MVNVALIIESICLNDGGIGDRALLAGLINLAKSRPEFIMKDLIKVKNENEVEVTLYEPSMDLVKMKVKGESLSYSYPISNSKKLLLFLKLRQ